MNEKRYEEDINEVYHDICQGFDIPDDVDCYFINPDTNELVWMDDEAEIHKVALPEEVLHLNPESITADIKACLKDLRRRCATPNTLHVASEFSKNPGPRYISEGRNSGELFLRELLYPRLIDAILSGTILEVNLDGTNGYGVCFLEGSFGELVYRSCLSPQAVASALRFVSKEEPDLPQEILEYINNPQQIGTCCSPPSPQTQEQHHSP